MNTKIVMKLSRKVADCLTTQSWEEKWRWPVVYSCHWLPHAGRPGMKSESHLSSNNHNNSQVWLTCQTCYIHLLSLLYTFIILVIHVLYLLYYLSFQLPFKWTQSHLSRWCRTGDTSVSTRVWKQHFHTRRETAFQHTGGNVSKNKPTCVLFIDLRFCVKRTHQLRGL